MLTRVLLIVAGTICVVLGTIGIVVPLLPTVPFYLLAGVCFARSSRSFHYWIFHNRWFGKFLRDYVEGKGIPRSTKIISVTILWIVIAYSFFVLPSDWMRALSFVIGIGVTIHLAMLRTYRKPSGRSELD